MKTVHLIFGLHWHAPLGLSDHAFESIYQETHKHFLSTLYEIEKFPVTLHYSGIVLELLEKNHPEYVNLLDEMIKRKQIEFLGGGFYDPILALLPLSDKIGQIELSTTWLRSHFGKRPRGFWIPEQIWEPSLPNTLRSCGIEFTFLPEIAFSHAHCTDGDLKYPHLTEDHGKNLVVFPFSTKLGDFCFAKPPSDLINLIRQKATSDGESVCAIMVDGINYSRVVTQGRNKKGVSWFKEFFERLQENDKTIIPVTPSDFLKNKRVIRKIYFSAANSAAVYRATLPAASVERSGRRDLAKNGTTPHGIVHFKQVFTKYHESNLIYAKMMYTHLTVHQMRGDKSRKRSALEELWKGQCNDAYWHGDHLGIYNNSLRKEIYKSLLNAEKYSRIRGSFLSSIISTDFDFDGENELLYQSNELNVYVRLQGGMVFEIDYLPAAWNYCDTMTRIRENGMNTVDPECDPYPRKAFIEHFFTYNKKIRTGPLSARIAPLCTCPFENYTLTELKREQRQITFVKDVVLKNGKRVNALELQKQYCFKKNTIIVNYVIKNKGSEKIKTDFGVEINLSFLSPLKENLKVFDLSKKTPIELDAGRQERHNLKSLSIEDRINTVGISLSTQKPCVYFHESVMSHAPEKGKKREQFQQLCVFPSWTLELDVNEIWDGSIELSIQKL